MGSKHELKAEAKGTGKFKSFDELAKAEVPFADMGLTNDVGPETLVTPLLDYILIERMDQKLKGGLYLAAGASLPGPRHAKVIAVGPGRPSEWNAALIPMPVVKVGDTILYHGGAGTEWEGKWWILPRDVIGVLDLL